MNRDRTSSDSLLDTFDRHRSLLFSHSVTTFDVTEDRIRAIRLVVNPEKLGSVPSLERLEKKEA